MLLFYYYFVGLKPNKIKFCFEILVSVKTITASTFEAFMET